MNKHSFALGLALFASLVWKCGIIFIQSTHYSLILILALNIFFLIRFLIEYYHHWSHIKIHIGHCFLQEWTSNPFSYDSNSVCLLTVATFGSWKAFLLNPRRRRNQEKARLSLWSARHSETGCIRHLICKLLITQKCWLCSGAVMGQ